MRRKEELLLDRIGFLKSGDKGSNSEDGRSGRLCYLYLGVRRSGGQSRENSAAGTQFQSFSASVANS